MGYETIGEFSRRTGLSVRALRLYDELGILRPTFVDTRSAYRFYDPSQGKAASLIRLLRASGHSLPAISEIVGMVDREDVVGAQNQVDRHWSDLEERHAQTRTVVALVRRFIDEEAAKVSSTIPSRSLAAALGQVVPAAGDDNERPVLMSVLFEGRAEGLRMVATDSFRLAVRDLPGVGLLDDGRQVLVPAALLRELEAALADGGEVGMGVSEGRVAFDVGDERIAGDSVQAEFPDYRVVLDGPEGHELNVSRAGLLEAANAAMQGREGNVLALDLGETITAHAISADGQVGDASEVTGTWAGPPMVVGLKPRFLLDGIRTATTEGLRLLVTDARRPIRVGRGGDEFVYVLMPVPVPAAGS